ncbi:aquaporin [Arthrobacter sp. efr-133-R2A-63]|uniref:MIP/aquaporin family protein n=1 Tax=Arthrobacter sp. efr-133-R2A-63 TaxID=3040278 RepID=UPI00254C51CE|nr:aquaporin [Arthrobacter sp. efr-133-R2A-63]
MPIRDAAGRSGRRRHPGLSVQDHRMIRTFNQPGNGSRRLIGEFLGTYLLVLAAAGADIVNTATHGGLGHTAMVMTPALTIIAVVLFVGPISGAHLNPVVTLAFALRRDFPWPRVPGYILVQAAGAALASATLLAVFGHYGKDGMTVPGPEFTDFQAFTLEVLLTAGLVSTVLAVASGAQNVGALSAFGIAAYIVMAGLWGGPVSGASMNPIRSFGPDLITGDFSRYWIYATGPVAGALLAVAIAHVLRGRGGRAAAEKAAQGSLSG